MSLDLTNELTIEADTEWLNVKKQNLRDSFCINSECPKYIMYKLDNKICTCEQFEHYVDYLQGKRKLGT
jgi:hypothetical protein